MLCDTSSITSEYCVTQLLDTTLHHQILCNTVCCTLPVLYCNITHTTTMQTGRPFYLLMLDLAKNNNFLFSTKIQKMFKFNHQYCSKISQLYYYHEENSPRLSKNSMLKLSANRSEKQHNPETQAEIKSRNSTLRH